MRFSYGIIVTHSKAVAYSFQHIWRSLDWSRDSFTLLYVIFIAFVYVLGGSVCVLYRFGIIKLVLCRGWEKDTHGNRVRNDFSLKWPFFAFNTVMSRAFCGLFVGFGSNVNSWMRYFLFWKYGRALEVVGLIDVFLKQKTLLRVIELMDVLTIRNFVRLKWWWAVFFVWYHSILALHHNVNDQMANQMVIRLVLCHHHHRPSHIFLYYTATQISLSFHQEDEERLVATLSYIIRTTPHKQLYD